MNPRAVQMLLPFMQKLGQSTRAEQPFAIEQAMRQMVLPKPAPGPTPWQRLIESVPRHELAPGVQAVPRGIRDGWPSSLDLRMGANKVSASPREARPDTVHIDSMVSDRAARRDVGSMAGGLEDYTMDISSPAQRELPLRGMKLDPKAKAARPVRSPEARYDRADQSAMAWRQDRERLPQRQQEAVIDRFMDLLRRAGHKNLEFTAEAGERPRLYEKLTGYKAQPQGEATMESLLERPLQRAAPANPRQALLAPDATLSPQILEQMLGLSVDEAVEFGLVRRMGQAELYKLTDQGRQQAATWFGGGASL